MHDHLCDLGRQMADELGPPRLWKPYILRMQKDLNKSDINKGQTDLLWLESVKLKGIPSWIPLRKLQYLSVCGVEDMWSTFQQQLQIKPQASFELRKLQMLHSPSLQKLPDLIGMFSHLEELGIGSLLLEYIRNSDIASLLESIKQLSNLRSLKLWCQRRDFIRDLNCWCKCRDSIRNLNLWCERLDFIRDLNLWCEGHNDRQRIEWMWNLNEMEFKQLEGLNTLEVFDCDNLATIAGGIFWASISDCEGLVQTGNNIRVIFCKRASDSYSGGLFQIIKIIRISFWASISYCEVCHKLETISRLSSVKGLPFLEVEDCPQLEIISGLFSGLKSLKVKHHQLQCVEGFEEWQGLKSLIVEVPENGYAWVQNCIYELKVGTALSRLNVNLFFELICVRAFVEIKRGLYALDSRSSSSAITIYALLGTYNKICAFIRPESILSTCGEFLIRKGPCLKTFQELNYGYPSG
ncbi:hypothetical protein SUGI_0603390 [Cryptomeria japonica]|nr:hypothetical protein SUGI_0603390 [Cryptomeria japonica]